MARSKGHTIIQTSLLQVGLDCREMIVEYVIDVGVMLLKEILRLLHIISLCKRTFIQLIVSDTDVCTCMHTHRHALNFEANKYSKAVLFL